LSISPTSGEQSQTFDVVITGGGFVNGLTTAEFGGASSGITVNSVTVTDPDHATANITIASNAPLTRGGIRPLSVTVRTGSSRFTQTNLFTVQAAALSISPTSGEQLQTFDVVITGGGFVNGVTTAEFGGASSGITVNSVTVTDPDHATANITIAYNAPIQTVDVSAITAGSSIVAKQSFTVQP